MNKRALAVFVAGFLTIFTAYAIRYGYGILLIEMLPALAITKAEAGVIFSSFFVTYTLMSPLLGLLGDRFGARLLLPLFVAILGAGTFLMGYSSSVTQSSLFYALAGIGAGACWAPVMALVQRWSSEEHRGKTLAFVDVGSSLGIIVSSTAVSSIISANSWATGWQVLGIMTLTIAVLDLVLVKEPPGWHTAGPKTETPQISGESVKITYAGIIRDGKFWLIGVAYLLMAFSVIIPITFLSTYAIQEREFSAGAAARLITVIGVGAFFGKLGLGAVSDRVGRIRMMMLCSLLVVAGCLGIAYGRDWALYVFTAVFSMGFGAFWPMYAAAASDYFHRKHSGGIIGLWTVFMGVGSIVAPSVSGWIADTTGTLSWSFVLGSAGAAVSLLLLVPVWRSK
ncbi:MAG: MFS transporter [Dehalococcoidia bacterium]|jgi:sugar phosphate permease